MSSGQGQKSHICCSSNISPISVDLSFFVEKLLRSSPVASQKLAEFLANISAKKFQDSKRFSIVWFFPFKFRSNFSEVLKLLFARNFCITYLCINFYRERELNISSAFSDSRKILTSFLADSLQIIIPFLTKFCCLQHSFDTAFYPTVNFCTFQRAFELFM